MTAGVIRPEKGTPEFELWVSAIDVAHAAPLKRGTYSHTAQVPWTIINEVRAALEAVGIDWKGTHPKNPARQTDGR